MTVVFSMMLDDEVQATPSKVQPVPLLTVDDSADAFSSPFPLNHRFSNS